jgi:hypothetical protein
VVLDVLLCHGGVVIFAHWHSVEGNPIPMSRRR